MNIELNSFLPEVMALPTHAIAFTANWRLKDRMPDMPMLQTSDSGFNIDDFAGHGHCRLSLREEFHANVESDWNWDTESIEHDVTAALFDVEWNELSITILRLSWPEQYCKKTVHWLMGQSEEVLEDFFTTVSRWWPPTEPTIEVFQAGYWQPSRTLYKSIKSATFDNLVLAPGLQEELQTDLAHFFASQELYDRYRIPWKRGVILAGPPGNGKTHAVKALINWLDKTALYVKSLQSHHHNEHLMMHQVFERARSVAPCLLVFEDLESIVTPTNRSFFLNELDGFAANRGIVVLATTNHPEKLDPALTERPSRFDRKYFFNMPGPDERSTYLSHWNREIEAELRLTEAGLASISEATEGFSFAFLKELIMSSLMRWINLGTGVSMDGVMHDQVNVLRSQMSTQTEDVPSVIVIDDEIDGE